MGRRMGVLAGLAIFAASACSGAPATTSTGSLALESASRLIEADTCLGGARFSDSESSLADAVATYGLAAYEALADDPSWTDVVDCSEPHTFEVYGVVSLPAELDDRISSYSDLLTPSSGLAGAIHEALSRECAAAINPTVSVPTPRRLDVDTYPLTPADIGAFTTEPSPPTAWVAGDRTFGCLFEQPTPATVMVDDLTSPAFPLDERTCLEGTRFVTCTKPHDVERIATLVVDRAVDAKELAGLRAVDEFGSVDLGDEQWAALDTVCQDYLAAISDEPTSGLRGVADTYPELYPDDEGQYSILCTAQSRFGTSSDDKVVSSTSVYNE
jgi:hypothetical protein